MVSTAFGAISIGIPDHQGKSGIRGVAHVVTPRMSKKERGFDAFPAELVPT
jgi:hypothetical protein